MERRRAVVLEVRAGRARVLDESGRFRDVVPAGPDWSEGAEVWVPEPRSVPGRWLGTRSLRWAASAAVAVVMALALVPVLSDWQANAQTLAYVSVDINPSVRLAVNSGLRVIRGVGLDSDGSRLLREVPVAGLPLAGALEHLVARAVTDGFVRSGQPGAVVIAASPARSQMQAPPPAVEAAVSAASEQVYTDLRAHGISAPVVRLGAGPKEVAAARKVGLSLGQYAVWRQAGLLHLRVTPKELRHVDIVHALMSAGVAPGRIASVLGRIGVLVGRHVTARRRPSGGIEPGAPAAGGSGGEAGQGGRVRPGRGAQPATGDHPGGAARRGRRGSSANRRGRGRTRPGRTSVPQVSRGRGDHAHGAKRGFVTGHTPAGIPALEVPGASGTSANGAGSVQGGGQGRFQGSPQAQDQTHGAGRTAAGRGGAATGQQGQQQQRRGRGRGNGQGGQGLAGAVQTGPPPSRRNLRGASSRHAQHGQQGRTRRSAAGQGSAGGPGASPGSASGRGRSAAGQGSAGGSGASPGSAHGRGRSAGGGPAGGSGASPDSAHGQAPAAGGRATGRSAGTATGARGRAHQGGSGRGGSAPSASAGPWWLLSPLSGGGSPGSGYAASGGSGASS